MCNKPVAGVAPLFVAHIDMHIFSQRPRCGDGLSQARADLVGSLVPQLGPCSCEDSWPVNHPVAIDDGDAARGHQGWRGGGQITQMVVVLNIQCL